MLLFTLHLITLVTLFLSPQVQCLQLTVIAYEGDNAEFHCLDKLQFKGTPHSTVEWYMNDSLVDKKIHGRLNYSIRRNLIRIDNVQPIDGGLWAAKLRFREQSRQPTLPAGKIDSETINWCNFTLLIVNQRQDVKLPETDRKESIQERVNSLPPKFTKLERMLRSQYVTKPAGTSVTLKCDANGYPTPVVKWSKNGELIDHRRGSVERRKWSLKLKMITKQDCGQYTCTVSNFYGSVNFTYNLTVPDIPHRKPNLLDLQNVTVRAGETARLNCSTVPQEYLSHVEWLRRVAVNGSFFDSSGAPFFEDLDVDDSEGRDRRVLSIEDVTSEDNGRYFCIIRDEYGTSVQNAWLIAVDEVDEKEMASDRFLASTAGLVGGALVILCSVFVFLIIRKCRRGNYETRNVSVDNSPYSVSRYPHPQSVVQSRGHQLIDPLALATVQLTKQDLINGQSLDQTDLSIDSHLEFPLENLELGDCLSRGTFSQIVQARAYGIVERHVVTDVAVKTLNENHTKSHVADLLHQLELMKTVGKHDNVLSLLGYCCVDGIPCYVIVELCSRGSLLNFLGQHRSLADSQSPPDSGSYLGEKEDRPFLSNIDMVSLAYQVALGMDHLASKKVVHQDLAARNVLVDVNGVLKISHYGISRRDFSKNQRIQWKAPECLESVGSINTIQSDVWSFGILFWEIVTLGQQRPYADLIDTDKLFHLLIDGFRLEKPPGCRLDMYEIMSECWQIEPEDRPTFHQLVKQLTQLQENNS